MDSAFDKLNMGDPVRDAFMAFQRVTKLEARLRRLDRSSSRERRRKRGLDSADLCQSMMTCLFGRVAPDHGRIRPVCERIKLLARPASHRVMHGVRTEERELRWGQRPALWRGCHANGPPLERCKRSASQIEGLPSLGIANGMGLSPQATRKRWQCAGAPDLEQREPSS